VTVEWKRFAVAVLCNAAWFGSVAGQTSPPATILKIDVENFVAYRDDTSDYSKLATNPGITSPIAARTFWSAVAIADIVSVNGAPAKGTLVFRQRNLRLTPTPQAGSAAADITRGDVVDEVWEILQADGTPVGTILANGLAGGTPPPGAPLASMAMNLAVTGGTGAFLGARGQAALAQGTTLMTGRDASVAEDPANRRSNGGGQRRFILHLIPMSRPEIVIDPSGSAAFHADLSPVTAAKPAKAGEALIVKTTGLGPTRPGVDPGQPFPTDALQEINSPLEVIVNGQSSVVINKVGWPGLVDTYRVDFRVPDGTAPGMAAVELSAAWMAGPPVRIPAQ